MLGFAWSGDGMERTPTAVSSRGLGHGPLKAGTRVRIPLSLPCLVGNGSIVYRLGHDPFTVERRVRFPLELCDSIVNRLRERCAGVVAVAIIVAVAVLTQAAQGVWGRSSVWLEHSTVTREVAGSSPVAPVVEGPDVTGKCRCSESSSKR